MVLARHALNLVGCHPTAAMGGKQAPSRDAPEIPGLVDVEPFQDLHGTR
jgi:hypothetical protein